MSQNIAVCPNILLICRMLDNSMLRSLCQVPKRPSTFSNSPSLSNSIQIPTHSSTTPPLFPFCKPLRTASSKPLSAARIRSKAPSSTRISFQYHSAKYLTATALSPPPSVKTPWRNRYLIILRNPSVGSTRISASR